MWKRRFPPLLLILLTLSGCLEREETIEIKPDGSLDVVHRISGDKEDLERGPARMPDKNHFRTERSIRVKDDGNVEHILTARARFASAKVMPTRFGPKDDPLGSRALTFHTDVKIRREGRRTFYRFIRTYAPRTWAPYRFFWKRSFPEDVQKLIDDASNIGRKSPRQRRQLIEAILTYQRRLLQHWAEEAMAQVAPEHGLLPEAQLAVREAIAEYFRNDISSEALNRALARPVEEIEKLGMEIYRNVNQLTIETATKELGLVADRVAELKASLNAERQDFEISRDLEDENFIIRVKLPGQVTADNAGGRENSYLVWRFDGKDLRDRKTVLMATSVIANK